MRINYLFLCRDREAARPADKVCSLLGLVDAEPNLKAALMRYVEEDHGQGWRLGHKRRLAFHYLYLGCAIELAKRNGWQYVLQMVGKPSFLEGERRK